jgi:hypothetical protein
MTATTICSRSLSPISKQACRLEYAAGFAARGIVRDRGEAGLTQQELASADGERQEISNAEITIINNAHGADARGSWPSGRSISRAPRRICAIRIAHCNLRFASQSLVLVGAHLSDLFLRHEAIDGAWFWDGPSVLVRVEH